MSKILVALSGGVDSAVAAMLLKQQGHELEAAFMKTWMHEDESDIFADCPWEEDMEDARAVAEHLDIPFRVVNLIRDYRERIVNYMVDGYRSGITPNPDVMCNREMKFGVFMDYAVREGFEGVATGHYCRSERADDGRVLLREGVDKNKDQSYFLALVNQQQMQRAWFPIGEIEKPQVRVLAKEHDLPNATKKDSQGICFLGKVNINDFLEQFIEERPGDIVQLDGTVRGQHKGLHRYTLGQRKGINVPSNTDNEHFIVVAKDYEKNHLIIAFDKPETPGLYTDEERLQNLSWVGEPVTETCKLLAKVRYRDPSTPITFEPQPDGTAIIRFDNTQRALAKGQVCALYEGDVLLGGGFYY